MMARPVVTSVSHATRPVGSCARMASRIASEIWSAILSGWPSVTDSEVKRWRPLRLMRVELLLLRGRKLRARLVTRTFLPGVLLSEDRHSARGRAEVSNPANIAGSRGTEQHATGEPRGRLP